jgi:hypothetical protein
VRRYSARLYLHFGLTLRCNRHERRLEHVAAVTLKSKRALIATLQPCMLHRIRATASVAVHPFRIPGHAPFSCVRTDRHSNVPSTARGHTCSLRPCSTVSSSRSHGAQYIHVLLACALWNSMNANLWQLLRLATESHSTAFPAGTSQRALYTRPPSLRTPAASSDRRLYVNNTTGVYTLVLHCRKPPSRLTAAAPGPVSTRPRRRGASYALTSFWLFSSEDLNGS